MKKLLANAVSFAVTWWKVALAIIAAVSLSFILGQCDGRSSERARWEARAEKAKADGLARARAADEQRREELSNTANSINQTREELDNATRNLPDESPSARRRARVCLELREQARRSGAPAPAC